MKKIILILTFLLLIPACTHYEELNSLSIISNISIEKDESAYKVTLQEIIPSNKDKSIDYDYIYRTSSNNNLEKAFKNIINHSPKKIYLRKVQNIIIGNKNKKDSINEFLKYYKKLNINKDSNIVITKNSIKKTLKINNDYKYIDSVLKNRKTTLRDIERHKKRKVPIIKINNKELIFLKYYKISISSWGVGFLNESSSSSKVSISIGGFLFITLYNLTNKLIKTNKGINGEI